MRFSFKRKLTHGERVSVAKQQAEQALSLFTTAHNHLEEANAELANVVIEARQKAKEYLLHVESATYEIGMNKEVQDKLKNFIPKS
jgi:NOL1/NOP2/fmu family ribosome biogenesis protein